MRWELMFPSEYLRAADIIERGGEVTATIEKIMAEDIHVINKTGKQEQQKKYTITFQKAQKRLVLNKTNAKSIATMLGKNTTDWTGKQITLYATTCRAFGRMEDCIRIKEHNSHSN